MLNLKSMSAWIFSLTRLRGFALACALASAVAVSPAHAESPPATGRNIVLVHGAFADGSSWTEVIRLLQSKGYHVTAVQNPLTSLAEDVAATRRVLERQNGDVILVGHSWAGVVITEAGNAPNVKTLVYLSALVPDSHESVGDLLTRLNAPMDGLKPDVRGLIWLDDPDAYRRMMAGDVPEPRVRVLTAAQQPMTAAAFGEKIFQAAWHNKPSWYLITEDDQALKPAVQHALAAQIHARSVAIKSSHLSLISHPEDVARLIERAAEETK